MSTRLFHDEEEEESLFQRHRWLLPLILVAAAGGIGFAATQYKGGPSAPVRAPEHMMTISLPPLPPPPPPKIEPPKVEPPKEEKKEEMVPQEEVKPDEKPPEAAKPADEPPPLGTNNTGPGSDNFGLGGYKPGGIGNGSGIGGPGGGGGRSKFGWYAAKVQASVAEAMRHNSRTRTASMSLQVRIWADSDGRISRAQLIGSSGDAGVDSALTNDVLTGLRLDQAPPQDMPMPIVMRLTAKKPN